MVPTNSIAVFLRHNDSELRYMVSKICSSLKYYCNMDDLIQDIYVKFLTAKTLQSYNRNFCTGKSYSSSKLSTFLYPILRNYILSMAESVEQRMFRSQVSNYDIEGEEVALDESIQDSIAPEYKTILANNEASDTIHGTGYNLRDFEEKFKRSIMKKRSFKKKKDVKFPESTLLKVFQYLYKGYSCKEIAEIYGVSNMRITNLKREIRQIMLNMGYDFSMD
jgi:RNA polymerase sigma factor (sigma-70 family)